MSRFYPPGTGPIEHWVTAAGMPALDELLSSVAYGAKLTIEPRIGDGGASTGYIAKLESRTGARYASAESANLGDTLIELAKRWDGT